MEASQSSLELESDRTFTRGLTYVFILTAVARYKLSTWMLLGSFFLILGASVYSQTRKEITRYGYPVLGRGSYWRRRTGTMDMNRDCLKLLSEGYQKFSKFGKIWATWAPNDEVICVVPPEVCDEIKNLSTKTLSFAQAIEDNFKWSLHTNMLDRIHIECVRTKLNSNLLKITPFLLDQRDEAVERLFPKTPEWKISKAWDIAWEIMHSIDAATILGLNFSRNKKYIHHIKKYCEIIPMFSFFYFLLPSILRYPFWLVSPFGFIIRYHIRALKGLLIPQIECRLAAIDSDEESEFALIDALLRSKPKPMNKEQIEQCAEELCFMTFEGVGPMTLLLMQLMYEILSQPAYLEDLRDEISKAVREVGGWSDQTLKQMPKLESFTRETLRLNGPAPFTVTRIVHQPIQLSDGTTLHPGMMITTPSQGIHTDEEFYKNAECFDGYRFYDKETGTVTVKASTTNNKFLVFGYGTQACPGRHFGVKACIMTFAKLLHEYDMEFFPARDDKPKNLVMPGQVMPDMTTRVRVRERRANLS